MIRRLLPAACLCLLVAAIVAGALLLIGYRNARADPIVRRAAVALPDWPTGAPPITVALMSDIHMESAAMDEARLGRIVAQVNALHPDLIVLAGDFVEGEGADQAQTAIPLLERPLARLHAPLGVVAAMGNHDYWTDPAPVAAMLSRAGIAVIRNAARPVGPLALAGLDDQTTRHAHLHRTIRALSAIQGAGVMIAHSPAIAPRLPPRIHLLFAGHTHCGQIILPFYGPPIEVAPRRYRCGITRDPGRITIVTGGVGTSEWPLRFGAPPDLWLVRLGPAAPVARSLSPPRP